MAQKTRFHLYGIRFIITLLLVMSSGLKAYSQTDMTSYITNPSFENDWTGWTHKNLGLQGNDAFTLKSGNVYVEKWTGAGGAVGSGSVKQVLTGLTPGNYQLTAVAQNIQQESATDLQTGAYIFAGDSRTMITLPNTYTVAFTYISGKITIGFEAVDASGNYICVDDFHLALIDQNGRMTLTDYALATNQERSTASRDLKKIVSAPDSPIVAEGAHSHKVWVRRK